MEHESLVERNALRVAIAQNRLERGHQSQRSHVDAREMPQEWRCEVSQSIGTSAIAGTVRG